jgi:N-acetylglucosamine malate deacetylase 1
VTPFDARVRRRTNSTLRCTPTTDAEALVDDEPSLSGRTLLVGLAHPDDELGAAGAILAQRSRGDRVVIVWLSRGEQTEAFGPLPIREVAVRREEQGHRAAEILGADSIFLDFSDTAITHDRHTTLQIARLLCRIQPDGLVTWGDAWVRGMRHPDHQATGAIFRDAVTLARIAKLVDPLPPHRNPVPIFTIRDVHSTLPGVGVDVSPHWKRVAEVAELYYHGVGFGDPVWFERRLRQIGSRYGFEYAEEFDAWESRGGPVPSLLPAPPLDEAPHPDRPPRAEPDSQ